MLMLGVAKFYDLNKTKNRKIACYNNINISSLH